MVSGHGVWVLGGWALVSMGILLDVWRGVQNCLGYRGMVCAGYLLLIPIHHDDVVLSSKVIVLTPVASRPAAASPHWVQHDDSASTDPQGYTQTYPSAPLVPPPKQWHPPPSSRGKKPPHLPCQPQPPSSPPCPRAPRRAGPAGRRRRRPGGAWRPSGRRRRRRGA